jgi:signal transduction histidine kinase
VRGDGAAGPPGAHGAHVGARGSRVPARWRIVAWLLLTTASALAGVVLVVRDNLTTQVSRSADAEVLQEVEEFAAFVSGGGDPATAQPFTSTERLLEVYLGSQYPGDNEMLVGLSAGPDPVVLLLDREADTDDAAAYPGLASDAAALAAMSDPDVVSGVRETPAGPMRWGRVDIVGATPADPGGSLIITQFTQPRSERVDRVVRLIAGVAVGGLLLAAGVAWLVAGQILAPVSAVRRVAAEIDETDLARRVPVRGRDDVAALATTFNAMLDRVEEAYRIQRSFVDDAGHELRTPITVVRGHLELMGEDPAERAATLHLVDDELARMNRIVSELLVLAKAERPDFVRTAEVDVEELTLEIDAKAQALGDRRWVLSRVGVGTAALDAQRVTQALLQLAANAVAHTRPGSEIRLGSRIIGGPDARVSFWVADTGPGVRAEDTTRIFERFAHGSAGLPEGERPGAGLGLAIVRAIADAHGGRAWVTSRIGHGATFGIDLPGARPSVRTPATDPPQAPTVPQQAPTVPQQAPTVPQQAPAGAAAGTAPVSRS